MVVVEGVARGFDPKLDIWTTADPVVREWIARNLGPLGKIEGVVHGAGDLGKVLAGLPAIAARSVAVLNQVEEITRNGLVLAPETVAAIGKAEARRARWQTAALWVMALAFLGILWRIW
jgi:ubiquinone biosynthesis protein